MKVKKSGGTRTSASQLPLDFSKLANNTQKATRACAEVIGMAQFRSAKIRDVLIADLLKTRVPK